MNLSSVPLQPAGPGRRSATASGASWLLGLDVIGLDGNPFAAESGSAESALLVLSGTHDFVAGGKQWPQRGVRTQPSEGRPLALYLPPGTPFSIANGRGDVLWLRARVPTRPPAAGSKEELARKPLLVLSGSGKAFDPASGAWRPEEEFADSPEFLLPRHIQGLEVDGVRVERIFPPTYKSRVLGLEEAVLPAGKTWRPAASGGAPPASAEAAVYHRAEGRLVATCGKSRIEVAGEGVVLVPDARELVLAADGGRAYVALCSAAPKSST